MANSAKAFTHAWRLASWELMARNAPARQTGLQSFSGQGGLSGYLGLLQIRQQIRNGEDNLDLQLRTLDRLVAPV